MKMSPRDTLKKGQKFSQYQSFVQKGVGQIYRGLLNLHFQLYQASFKTSYVFKSMLQLYVLLYNYYIFILNLILIRFVFKHLFIIYWLIYLSNFYTVYFFIFIDLYFKNLQILIYQYLALFLRQVIILLFYKNALKTILVRRYFQAFQRFLYIQELLQFYM